MKWIILLAICIAVAAAQNGRNHPRVVVEEIVEEEAPREERPPRLNEEEVVVEEEEPPKVPQLQLPREDEELVEVIDEEVEEVEEKQPEEKQERREHPCNTHHCSVGKECVLDKEENPKCECIKKCAKNKDDRAKICTTANVTMETECEMHRQICLCHRQEDGCIDPSFRNAELDYYGPCKEFKKCSKWEMEQFPERMRDWLFIVMEELAQRDDLNNKAKKMASRAGHVKKTKKSLHWAIPAIWKFCDLDHSHDQMVTFHEMIPMSAPLKGMEHCTQPFLDACDHSNDGDISRSEWIKCLKITSEHQDDLEMKCDQFQ